MKNEEGVPKILNVVPDITAALKEINVINYSILEHDALEMELALPVIVAKQPINARNKSQLDKLVIQTMELVHQVTAQSVATLAVNKLAREKDVPLTMVAQAA